MMQPALLILLLLLVVLISTAVEDIQGLQVHTDHIPESCTRRTKDGDRVFVRYSGSIDASSKTGTPHAVFDTNVNKKSPFEFFLGRGTVIKGWDIGLLDMCAGEKRTLIIPPDLGYGSRGYGRTIPKGKLPDVK